jgi:hypothetical protein
MATLKEFKKTKLKENQARIMATYDDLIIQSAELLKKRDEHISSQSNIIAGLSVVIIVETIIILMLLGKCLGI